LLADRLKYCVILLAKYASYQKMPRALKLLKFLPRLTMMSTLARIDDASTRVNSFFKFQSVPNIGPVPISPLFSHRYDFVISIYFNEMISAPFSTLL